MVPGTTKGAAGRRVAAAVGTCAVLLASGCGGGDESDPSEAARAAADQFVGAVEAREFDDACADLTDELAAQLGGERCAEQIASVAGEGDVEIEVTGVRVSGPKAVAQTEVRRSGAGPQESSLELVEGEDGWRVSRIGD